MKTPDALLSERDLQRITGRSASSWQKDRVQGTGPRYIRVGRLVRYRTDDVEAYLRSRTVSSTSEAK
jgi:predicted DNA-binding transcriptional regulator AlpA